MITCTACTYDNAAGAAKCEICGPPLPVAAFAAAPPPQAAFEAGAFEGGNDDEVFGDFDAFDGDAGEGDGCEDFSEFDAAPAVPFDPLASPRRDGGPAPPPVSPPVSPGEDFGDLDAPVASAGARLTPPASPGGGETFGDFYAPGARGADADAFGAFDAPAAPAAEFAAFGAPEPEPEPEPAPDAIWRAPAPENDAFSAFDDLDEPDEPEPEPEPEPTPAPEPPGTAAELGTPHAPHAPGFGTCGEPGNVCWREWSAALTAPPVGSGGGRRWMGVVRGTPSGVAPHTTGASGGSQPASLEAAAAAAARAVAARRSTMCAGRGGGLRCFRAATSSGRVNLLPPSPSSVAPCGTPGGGGGSVGGGRWAVRVGA